MRFITKAKQKRISELLAKLYFLIVRFQPGEFNHDFIEKSADTIIDIAYEIGGWKMAEDDIPRYYYSLSNRKEEQC